jgi:hypothetical protein
MMQRMTIEMDRTNSVSRPRLAMTGSHVTEILPKETVLIAVVQAVQTTATVGGPSEQ